MVGRFLISVGDLVVSHLVVLVSADMGLFYGLPCVTVVRQLTNLLLATVLINAFTLIFVA